ncbi:hypothetical protein ACQY1Q_13605 [Tenacibaculum sp. TC6]|uniref:hypothetical protein n=1 Tax=Tenacibaculum sp. TC6 TaxID=3423223 RepID=UPI003D363CAB
MPPIKAKRVKIEETISELNIAYHHKELEIVKMRAEYQDLCVNTHEIEHRYYNQIAFGECKPQKESDIIPPIRFEEDTQQSPYALDKDVNDFKYASYVPKVNTPEDIELIRYLDESIHEGACQIMSVNESQFRRGRSIKPLPKVIREEPKVSLYENMKAYMSVWTLPFTMLSLLLIYIAEGVIVQNVFHTNLGFSEPKSWLCATMIVGVTYIISRVLFGASQHLLERTKGYPILITLFSVGFFMQVLGSGLLTNYNIRLGHEKKELQSDKLRLGRMESILEDSYEVNAELQGQITKLQSDIDRRFVKYKEEPLWVIWGSYILVSFFSVLTLFASCILKGIGEQAKYVIKLKKTLDKNRKRILDLKESYDKEVENLLKAGIERQLFRYHLARKYFIEKLLTQSNSLDKQAYLKAYRTKEEAPFSDNKSQENGLTTHHQTMNTNF